MSSAMIHRFVAALVFALVTTSAIALEPVPDKLVVLTFDDSVKSQFTVVRPILLKYKFGATFFVTEGFDFKTNKQDYMTWEEIAQLHADGFEIGNHTRDHLGLNDNNVDQLSEQLEGIAQQCRQHAIPVPTSFAYPGNGITVKALPVLRQAGIQFARRGGRPEFPYEGGCGFAFEPGLDDPLLIPSAGDARPDWQLDDLINAASQARFGRIAVLQFHGVPDRAHAWVNTDPAKFEAYMHYLATNKYRVIAMRDLAKYVDPTVAPRDPQGVINDRRARLDANLTFDNFRKPSSSDEAYWLENMTIHGFSPVEMSAATGLTVDEITNKLASLKPVGLGQRRDEKLVVLPYPGGRHPRIGFHDGAIRPQRETKVSIFAPWKDGGYVVADIPEAIWFESEKKPALLYLAHAHVPTYWSRQGIELPVLEWERHESGLLSVTRNLPEIATFGAKITPVENAVRMELTIANRSKEPLRGLRVQNCVMLKAAVGFESMTNDNKKLEAPFVACRNATGDRWIISAWEPCQRAWGNPPCPCMHADPQFPDCPPGETRQVQGWLSFYEGRDIDAEIARIKQVWRR
jgi:peptidoglycan/xylan/chitin deacetylase (PgdA/CDA1 family)